MMLLQSAAYTGQAVQCVHFEFGRQLGMSVVASTSQAVIDYRKRWHVFLFLERLT